MASQSGTPSSWRCWRYSSTAGRSSGAKGWPAAPGSSPLPTCWIRARPPMFTTFWATIRAAATPGSSLSAHTSISTKVVSHRAIAVFVNPEVPLVKAAGAHNLDARFRAPADRPRRPHPRGYRVTAWEGRRLLRDSPGPCCHRRPRGPDGHRTALGIPVARRRPPRSQQRIRVDVVAIGLPGGVAGQVAIGGGGPSSAAPDGRGLTGLRWRSPRGIGRYGRCPDPRCWEVELAVVVVVE